MAFAKKIFIYNWQDDWMKVKLDDMDIIIAESCGAIIDFEMLYNISIIFTHALTI